MDAGVAAGTNGFRAIRKRNLESAQNVKAPNGMSIKSKVSNILNLLTKMINRCKISICAQKGVFDIVYIDTMLFKQF